MFDVELENHYRTAILSMTIVEKDPLGLPPKDFLPLCKY